VLRATVQVPKRAISPVSPRPAERTVAQRFDWYGAGLLLSVSIYLCANLFADPRTPFLLTGDQVFFWMRAQQLLQGEQIYRDFLEFTPPGTDLIYVSAFRLFGARIWVPNLVVLLLGTSLCWLCWHISRTLMKRSAAALTVALFLVLVYGRLLNGTQHWFSVLAVLGAVAVLMKATTAARIATAGALLGVATFFTQTRGPVAAAAIAAYMLSKQFRTDESWLTCVKRLLLLFVSLILTWTVLSSYYIATIGWQQLWFFQFTYVRRYALSGWNALSLGLPQALAWAALPAMFQSVFAWVVLPAVYAISLWLCWKYREDAPACNMSRVGLIAAAGTAMFLEIALSPSWFRFYCVAAPGVILLVWLIDRAGRFTGYALRLAWIGIVGVAAFQTWHRHLEQAVIEQLPAGRIATTPLAAEKLSWLAARTQPGQFFLQAGWPGVYLPLGLRNPIYVDDLDSAAGNRLGYLASSVRQLQARRVQYVLWSPRLDSATSGLAAFREFLHEHYRRVWTFSDQDEIWERMPEGTPDRSRSPRAATRDWGG
jgi:Dolichyl-phosphate-mannose-protein mannosyltransferase